MNYKFFKFHKKFISKYIFSKFSIPYLFSLIACSPKQESSSFEDNNSSNSNQSIIDQKTNQGNNLEKHFGVPENYSAPQKSYTAPQISDRQIPRIVAPDPNPYWVNSLIVEQFELQKSRLSMDNNIMFYALPQVIPDYLTSPVDLQGWQPANNAVQTSAKKIFDYFNKLFDVNFELTQNLHQQNVIAISQNHQTNTAGYAYNPGSSKNPEGSDVFISNEYSNPILFKNGANYDFEVLLHEISHSLGLKHSFEAFGENAAILPLEEEHIERTVMSYTGELEVYPAELRKFDIFALTKVYGINENINSGNNLYTFSHEEGVLIFDGGGVDVIDLSLTRESIFLDLRPGAHSYVGQKSSLISDPLQLSISYYSEIENVEGGDGNHLIIGNMANNIILTRGGDDKIFAGEGSDIVYSGAGLDEIDLSEVIAQKDIVYAAPGSGHKVIFGFDQLETPDTIILQNTNTNFIFTDIIDETVEPFWADNLVLPIIGEKYFPGHNSSIDQLDKTFFPFEVVGECYLIYSNSQETGKDQFLYNILKKNDKLEVDLLAIFSGNHMDIDNWGSFHFEFDTII